MLSILVIKIKDLNKILSRIINLMIKAESFFNYSPKREINLGGTTKEWNRPQLILKDKLIDIKNS